LQDPDLPLLIEGRVQGGIAHSLGQVLFERTGLRQNGQLLTGEFMDYAIPRAGDIRYIMGSTRRLPPSIPWASRASGGRDVGATPAIANAVIDALQPLGVRHLDLPLTPSASGGPFSNTHVAV
jgi:carbon-monoxide dehydrogenase large subunit